MDVKFITTTRELIDTVPITDGQVIACKDANDWFYDNYQTRYRVGAPIWEGMKESEIDGLFISDGTIAVIDFEANGGTSGVEQIVGKVNDEISDVTMPTCTRDGYTFLGWYEDSNLTKLVETLPAKMTQGRTIYYASWKKD